jgi:hypothetical protein
MHSWLGYIGFFSPLRCDGRRLTPAERLAIGGLQAHKRTTSPRSLVAGAFCYGKLI